MNAFRSEKLFVGSWIDVLHPACCVGGILFDRTEAMDNLGQSTYQNFNSRRKMGDNLNDSASEKRRKRMTGNLVEVVQLVVKAIVGIR